jgi:phospholipase C
MADNLGHHQRFGYFSKTGLPWKTVFDVICNPRIPSFLEDAAAGTLPSVSWIDPAFTNFNPLGFPVNDDHPPADIKDGQDLVLAVYDALAASPQWDRSLLVIVCTTKTATSTITSRRRRPPTAARRAA